MRMSLPVSSLLQAVPKRATEEMSRVYLRSPGPLPLANAKRNWQVSTVGSKTCSRHFSASPNAFVLNRPFTEEKLAIVRQAHQEGRTKFEVLELIKSASPHRPNPHMTLLYERALGKTSNSREYIMPSGKPKRRSWNAAEDDVLVRGRASGRSSRSMAEELGRSAVSVRSRTNAVLFPSKTSKSVSKFQVATARSHQSNWRRWPETDDRLLEEHWREGLPDSLIAEKLSISVLVSCKEA